METADVWDTPGFSFMPPTSGITKMQNPITRSMVTIEPPLFCTDEDRFKKFQQYFFNWCEALWEINCIDPTELVSDRDWMLSDKYAPVVTG